MVTQEANKFDKVLNILLIGFLAVFLAFCSSLVDPYLSNVATKYNYQGKNEALDEQTVEVFVDNDFLAYQHFVAELTNQLQGNEYAVALKYFPDSRKDFSINGDKIMSAASTYKLFTAYSMFKSGQAPSCLKDMIIYSDNTCPENWGRWTQITNEAHKLGALSTNLDLIETLTTANDLALYLTKLYDGSLLPNDQAVQLLTYMKTQVYREGIPAGIPSAEVADKVGFLNGELNDAGIVYSPKGDFVLVILTNGYSWGSIATTASEIYAKL